MINWSKIPNFKPEHFPENPDLYSDPKIMYALQSIRSKSRQLIFPSPAPGALARFDGNEATQHYVGNALNPTRKSTAIDFFMEGIPIQNLCTVMTITEIKGIGVYLDTFGPDGKLWVMFHIDVRENGFTDDLALLWICEKVWKPSDKKMINTYRYPQTTLEYWSLLQNDKMYSDKRHGKQGIKPAKMVLG